jgi:ribose 5-phosphate isomerase B
MKVYLASDHGGFQYKEQIKQHLIDQGITIEDVGAHNLDPGDDYPDFVIPLAQKVAQEVGSFGIILGRSGNGELIAANKVRGVRAIMGCNPKMAKMAREHNDANVLSLGADYIDLKTAIEVVDVFLKTPFSNKERHKRRLEKIKTLDNN